MISLRAEIAEAMREAARYAPHVTTGYEFRRMQSQPERHFAGRWFVGPHAVRRFLKRVPAARGWSYERALAAIRALPESRGDATAIPVVSERGVEELGWA